MTTLFVGNLPFDVTETDLRALFKNYGDIEEVRLVNDRVGKSRGFGFVEMRDSEAAERAKSAVDGIQLGGRRLRVNTAQPLEEQKTHPQSKHQRRQ